ncbi:unannotated protein [freshwater metagenome]|uniref:Unannotated protein n=1 Tax=freshwater metagenome TaxID=449393 RepID=A0A6J7I3C1_9ZZZZ|nr:hypothetical protein [Actinomycetota bacterium]
MARVARSRVIAATPQEIWRVAGDVRRLKRWWPHVTRVEIDDRERFTEVLRTQRGRHLRADFTLIEVRPEAGWRAAQELGTGPFAGVLSSHEKAIELAPEEGSGTRVTIIIDRRMRGRARLGGLFARRAAARQAQAALDALAVAVDAAA